MPGPRTRRSRYSGGSAPRAATHSRWRRTLPTGPRSDRCAGPRPEVSEASTSSSTTRGGFESHRILDVDLGHRDPSFALHVTAPLLITRLTVPAMIAQGSGCLVYTASTASREADAGRAAYTASRHATVGLMKTAAAEFGKHGIRANALAPGWVDTPMAQRHFERQAAESGEDFDALYRTEIASGMLRARITPQSVADTAVFLASDGARHVTAQTLYVCAGTVAT